MNWPGEIMTKPLIQPHGGILVNRFVSDHEREQGLAKAKSLPQLLLSDRSLSDLECIATGIYSPLIGFVSEKDYHSIVDTMHLSNGLAFSIPITLQVSTEESAKYKVGDEIALVTPTGDAVATMTLTDKYTPDQQHEAQQVYRTTDPKHPGVAAMLEAGGVYLGGPISVVTDLPKNAFADHNFTPEQTREMFTNNGWTKVVAFQTRNPIHRAHEYITKIALESVDGLFINPLVGATKSDDIPAHIRMQCYHVLIENYYAKGRVLLGVYPAAMRYAGPREAILHAVSRQNYGCSHFIVGRDHAGVGSYYGTYDAQHIFDELREGSLDITPLKFENSFYCNRTKQMATEKTTSSAPEERVSLSGTKVREMLGNGQIPPEEFSRPEVAKILIDFYRSKE
jgi:sulfate adenylyltransferase